jgi:dCMP deaminase
MGIITRGVRLKKRNTWDEYFLKISKVVASRSTCFRNQVGAVLVQDKDIVATGYNGAPSYQKNCKEIGFCYRDRHGIPSGSSLELCRAVGSHAESNSIVLAARNGHRTMGGTLYISGHTSICNQCKAIISNAKIKRVLLKIHRGETLEFFPDKDWTIHPIDQILPE